MSNLRRIDLNLLTVFDTVMAERNMSRAADKIGMSQPALSLAISRLRHIVDDPLFVRSGHGVRPTQKAMDMATPVHRALNIINGALETESEFDSGTSNRNFSLALGDAGDLLILPELMQGLEESQSSIQIDSLPFYANNIRKSMLLGEVDLCLWVEPFDTGEGDISSQKIATEKNVCIVRNDHPFTEEIIDYEQYANMKHLVMRLPRDYGTTVVDRELWKNNLKREYTIKVHNLHAYPHILESTNLVGTVPLSIARKFASEYNLRIIQSPIITDLPIYLSWPQSLDSDAGHQWLRQRVAKIYQEHLFTESPE